MKRRKVRRFSFLRAKGFTRRKIILLGQRDLGTGRKLFLGRDPQTSKLIFKRRHAQNLWGVVKDFKH